MNKSGFERRLREARRRAIKSFTLMDDIFMSAVFADNTECGNSVFTCERVRARGKKRKSLRVFAHSAKTR